MLLVTKPGVVWVPTALISMTVHLDETQLDRKEASSGFTSAAAVPSQFDHRDKLCQFAGPVWTCLKTSPTQSRGCWTATTS